MYISGPAILPLRVNFEAADTAFAKVSLFPVVISRLNRKTVLPFSKFANSPVSVKPAFD
ncbi:hypothetical protein D3C78_1802580 [compost metagenome]